MKIDIPVGAIARAEAAADTPIFNNDLERIAPANRTNRTADHAERIAALPAGSGDKIVVEAQTLAHQARNAIMRVGACSDAGVAAGAILQIQDQQTLRFHQSLRKELID